MYFLKFGDKEVNTWLGEDCDFYHRELKKKNKRKVSKIKQNKAYGGRRWKTQTSMQVNQTKGSEKVKAPTSQ